MCVMWWHPWTGLDTGVEVSAGQALWAGGVSPPPATMLGAPCAEDETLDLLFLV